IPASTASFSICTTCSAKSLSSGPEERVMSARTLAARASNSCFCCSSLRRTASNSLGIGPSADEGGGAVPPPRVPSVYLYFDRLGLRRGQLGHPDLQHAVLALGLDRADVGVLRQTETARKVPVEALHAMDL